MQDILFIPSPGTIFFCHTFFRSIFFFNSLYYLDSLIIVKLTLNFLASCIALNNTYCYEV